MDVRSVPAGVAYRITHRATGKSYIGISVNVKARWQHHLRVAAKGGSTSPVQAAIAQYGREAFDFEVIASSVTRENLFALERILILQHATYWREGWGYNLTQGGDGQLGLVHTPETRAKMSVTRRGRKHSPEHAAAIAAAHRGKPLVMTERRLAAIEVAVAAASRARTERASERKTQRAVEKAAKQEMVKQRLTAMAAERAARKPKWSRRPPTEETRAKLSAAGRGRPLSDAHKENIRKGSLLREARKRGEA